MRRGLINWDPHELPLAVLESRTQRLRAAMAAAGCDAIVLYTNFIRCAAVAWMTGFSPYWADGILIVPRDGELLFATTLSKRMGSWIQTVMPNATVVTSPNAGQLAGKRLSGIWSPQYRNSGIGRFARCSIFRSRRSSARRAHH